LLGTFSILKQGSPVALRGGGRTEALLSTLGLRYRRRVPRDIVLGEVWPNSDPVLSGQALNSLVHTLRKQLADALHGAPPVLCLYGSYCLNADAGVGVDIAWFDELAARGDRQARQEPGAAISSYLQAISLYAGDLHTGNDQEALIERERLRARYLTLLARAASYYDGQKDHESCLRLALRLLEHDPCREDAHRLVMRCHVRLGERAQALRQFRLCEAILRSEFDAAPEPATLDLYELIRVDPASV
jgi:DNA-binding SARP family transcriptional activator